MRLLILGSLAGPLADAARLAVAAGARVEQVDSRAGALARLRAAGGIDLLLIDLTQDVPAMVRALAAERIALPVVACAVAASPEAAAQAMRDGACEFLGLPADAALIAGMLRAAAGQPAGPVVRDPAMRALLRRAEQVAQSDASVLITGESGTGKEVVARHVHAHSRREAGPFIAVNCAAIPEALLESELFGHEKGAFSGAVARRAGRFEAAEGGTLLLDEISEMDVRLQAKLLRALQEREIDRLGGTAPVRINVRVLATSNRDLRAEAASGRFREDLYFRLNVVNLRLPPLRERPADIPALAQHYARHYAAANGAPVRPIAAAALALLAAQPWRGNVRELENAMHRAVLLATGNEIAADAFELAAPAAAPPASGAPTLVARRMADVEQELILNTLRHTLGNRTHAATLLGISIRALRNKLRDYAQAGIPVPPPQAGVAA